MDEKPGRSLVLVKPDGVGRGLIGKVLSAIEEEGLKIAELAMLTLDRERAQRFYGVHKEKGFFGDLIEFITSGPIVALVVEGDDVIPRVREIMGATNPKEARPGTIRARFGESIQRNVVHGSDSESCFEYEYEVIFGS